MKRAHHVPGPMEARLEAELRAALERAGATERTIASVMAAGCRLDGVGAAGVSAELTAAGTRLRDRIRQLADALDRLDRPVSGLRRAGYLIPATGSRPAPRRRSGACRPAGGSGRG